MLEAAIRFVTIYCLSVFAWLIAYMATESIIFAAIFSFICFLVARWPFLRRMEEETDIRLYRLNKIREEQLERLKPYRKVEYKYDDRNVLKSPYDE